ncbi:MAG: type IV pilus assembly protein PilM [Planctomycetota bacterium]
MSWKQSLGLANEVLGLDIGSSHVKLVELNKGIGGYTVTAVGVADVSSGDDSESVSESGALAAVRECVGSASSNTKMAVCSVSGPEVAVRSFKFPSLPAEEMSSAVHLEAGQVCPFNVDQSSVDYQLVASKGDNACGVMVAATNESIETKRQLAKDVSLNCVLMDVDGLALLNCFKELDSERSKKKVARHSTAILNVGNRYTTLAIVAESGLPFVRDVAYAGERIVAQIASEKNISVQAVRNALSGGDGSSNPAPNLSESFDRACGKLITDVGETLRYYTAQEKNVLVDEIFVCGGFALTKGFVELLDSKLSVKVSLWNPFDNIRYGASSGSEEFLANNGPALAVAAGLAMRSI